MNEKKQFSFHGEGGALLWLYIRTMFLTVITFGIYWPWAKARLNKFWYGNTSFGGSTFGFQGTGTEMFIGLLKGIGILILIAIPYIIGLQMGLSVISEDLVLGLVYLSVGLIIYIGLLLVAVPLAINSSLRYRMSRTTWRSIRWAYTGTNRELLPLYLKGTLLSMITLTIYNSWFESRLYKYIYSKLQFGSLRFRFKGEGKDLFFIGLKGVLLTLITGGIYLSWYLKNIYKYLYENMEVLQGDKAVPLKVNMTGGGLFMLMLTNILLLFFTLGIAVPWINVRTMKFILNNISAAEDIDVDAIEQTAVTDDNATGEELADLLDFGDWGIL